MRILRRFFTVALFFAATAPAPASGPTAHDFSFTSIEGGPLALSDYKGKALLVVNTASRCGFTGQYEGLQALYDGYRENGLVVLGIPSQDFRQELGSSEEVRHFCELNYGINFPMTEIERVRGKDAHPLFAWMADQGKSPDWNFNKFLIKPDGTLHDHFRAGTRPDSDILLNRIKGILPD